MAAILITGNPGSGKSAVAAELERRGQVAIDPDYDEALSHWEGPGGRVVVRGEAPVHPDAAWLRSHRWIWDRRRLSERLAGVQVIFVCGIAVNIVDLVDLFDEQFVLEIDGATQEQRLRAHDEMRPPGRSEAGRQQIRDGRAGFQEQMRDLGAISVDGSKATSAVVDEVLGHLSPDTFV